jgi:hypothetical protein
VRAPRITQRLRQQVIERARELCEYCKNQHKLLVAEFEVDHIYPQALGGPTQLDNLALACRHCNSKKWAQIKGVDPLTGRRVPLFNPRRQHWNRHFKWSDDESEIIGKTACGRATIDALQMNHPRLVRVRRLWRELGLHPPKR